MMDSSSLQFHKKGFIIMGEKNQLNSKKWYEAVGWSLFNDWLIELSARNITSCYVDNLEIIPRYLNKSTIIDCFNKDSNEWEMVFDYENDLILQNTYAQKGRRKKRNGKQ